MKTVKICIRVAKPSADKTVGSNISNDGHHCQGTSPNDCLELDEKVPEMCWDRYRLAHRLVDPYCKGWLNVQSGDSKGIA